MLPLLPCHNSTSGIVLPVLYCQQYTATTTLPVMYCYYILLHLPANLSSPSQNILRGVAICQGSMLYTLYQHFIIAQHHDTAQKHCMPVPVWARYRGQTSRSRRKRSRHAAYTHTSCIHAQTNKQTVRTCCYPCYKCSLLCTGSTLVLLLTRQRVVLHMQAVQSANQLNIQCYKRPMHRGQQVQSKVELHGVLSKPLSCRVFSVKHQSCYLCIVKVTLTYQIHANVNEMGIHTPASVL